MTTNYFQQGNQLLRENKLDEAIAFYLKAIEQNPNFYGYYQNLGELLVKQGKLDEALVNYRCAVDLNPNSAWSHNVLGEVYAQKEAWGKAIAAYKMANKINPDFYIFQENLNDALAKLEELENKNKIFQAKSFASGAIKVSDIEPESYRLYLDSADQLKRQGEVEAAIIDYLRAILARQKIHEPYIRLLDLLLYSKSYISTITLSAIIQVCQELIKKAEYHDNIVYLLLGRSLTRQGKIEKAKGYYQQAIYQQTLKRKPDYARKHWNSGKLKGADFIIIGAPKCGTTTLYHYLNQHPQILEAIFKELKYFETRLSEQKSDYYFAHFPPTPEDKSFITGEGNPACFYNNYSGRNSAQHIFNILPNIKLIALLRNPVDRAISQYHHWQKLGIETRSLESIIESEREKLQGISELTPEIYAQTGSGYLTKSLYFFYVKQWLSIFPREQILILKTEDFAQEPALIMNRVFEFLELPQYSIDSKKRQNVGSYDPISPDMRRRLSRFFQPYNRKLEEYLGMEFNWD